MNPAYLYALTLTCGFAGGFWLNGVLQENQQLTTVVQVQERVVTKVVVDRAETEKIRGEYLEFRKNALEEIDRYKLRIADGGLHVNAQCVPATGAATSGTTAGTARLTPQAQEDYFSFERQYADQLSLLQLCRNELIKRSAK